MRKLSITFLILGICLAFPLASHARPVAALEALEILRKGFAETDDFTAEITQEKQLSIMKRVMKTQGIVRFKKPDLFMMEIKPPYASRLLLRDNIIEQSAGDGKGPKNRIILPPEQSLKQWFDKLAAPVTKLPEGVSLKADKTASVYTLQITPIKRGQVRDLLISFHNDGTIRRIVINEQNGDRSTLSFRKFKRNTGLTERDMLL
ncbi:MAG TPA: outer membrane lipoprotein carrier protein LolA [Deltaproteobacteria bacterium]|nr:outer membrane lipoprotein carrier protein LolA [Deltaproteobacteria bacterium]HQB37710.1 outer membrane lipoprotein carrier protein LolA [Deltaproteobacteria bacterium]